jgi:alpha-ketoglutarate-dependent taurine dioxygenase
MKANPESTAAIAIASVSLVSDRVSLTRSDGLQQDESARFESILYDRNLWRRPLLAPGGLLSIDNHRVLHSRSDCSRRLSAGVF